MLFFTNLFRLRTPHILTNHHLNGSFIPVKEFFGKKQSFFLSREKNAANQYRDIFFDK